MSAATPLADRRVDLGLRARHDHDLGAELEQLGRDRAADAAGPTGHERVATAELPRRLRHGGNITR
jgi:hypothetical protein